MPIMLDFYVLPTECLEMLYGSEYKEAESSLRVCVKVMTSLH